MYDLPWTVGPDSGPLLRPAGARISIIGRRGLPLEPLPLPRLRLVEMHEPQEAYAQADGYGVPLDLGVSQGRAHPRAEAFPALLLLLLPSGRRPVDARARRGGEAACGR